MSISPKTLFTTCNDTTIWGSVTFRKGSMITCEGVDLFKEVEEGEYPSEKPPTPQDRLLSTEDNKLIETEDSKTILV